MVPVDVRSSWSIVVGLLFFLVSTAPLSLFVSADIIINEVMRNPTQRIDAIGEWFELYNTGVADVDLKGWTIKDNRRDSFKVATSVVIPAKGYALFAKSANPGRNGGLPKVNYVYAHRNMKFKFGDQLILIDAAGGRVDAVSWNYFNFPSKRGVAMALKSPTLNNGLAASWCLSQARYNGGEGDRGTPGAANDCPGFPPPAPVAPPTVAPAVVPPAVAPKAPTAPVVAPMTPVAPTVPLAPSAPTAPSAPMSAPAPPSPPTSIISRPVLIHAIQGSGMEVTDPGAVVNVTGAIVTSLFSRNDVLDGFFLQQADADADGNPLTSEGIFVFCRGKCVPATVTAGDRVVLLNAVVGEFAGTSQLDVRGANSSYAILSSNNPLPTPIDLTLPALNSTRLNSTYEQYEGMLVRFPETLIVSEYFQLAQFGQIILTHASRPTTFTQVDKPSVAGLAAFRQALFQRTIFLDDDNGDSNDAISGSPDEAYYYPRTTTAGNNSGLSTTNRFRGGDTITGLTGVLQFAFDAWRIRPVPQVYNYTFVPANPAPVQPKAVGGGRLRVTCFNVLNYFTTLDTGGTPCSPTGGLECRGAHTLNELVVQRTKIVAALDKLDADIVGLVELENSASDGPLIDLVTALNTVKGGPVYSIIPTGGMGTDAIRVGLIYKNSTVSPLLPFRILNATVDPMFNTDRNRPALVQTFGETSSGAKFTIAVNHFKSKGSNCNSNNDFDLLDGQAFCPLTRLNASIALARFLATDPTGSNDSDFLIIGDLNSYVKEDPIQFLINNASYVDLVNKYEGPNAYSYVFDGQIGYLDYALASSSLVAQVTGATEWHINADEIPLFDYNDNILNPGEPSFERKSSRFNLTTLDPLRSSDHDPVLIGLNLVA